MFDQYIISVITHLKVLCYDFCDTFESNYLFVIYFMLQNYSI
jgi:hypothetical protein